MAKWLTVNCVSNRNLRIRIPISLIKTNKNFKHESIENNFTDLSRWFSSNSEL